MKTISAVAVLALVAGSAAAQTYTIDFEKDAAGNNIANGATLSTQYAAWGATFVPNVLSGTTWATNTDMTITSTDVGAGYSATYGKVLHSFNGWLAEDGDPNFAIFFSSAISSLSVSFIGDSTGVSEVAAFDANGTFQTSGIVGAGGSSVLKTVTLTGLNTTQIGVILPGDFGDWAAVVSITYTLVPAPSSLALLGLGGLVAGRRRR